MQTISIYTQNEIILDDPGVNQNTYTVKFTLVDEVGVVVKDENNTGIKDRDAEFDVGLNRYVAKFKISPEVKGKYPRISFQITNAQGTYIVSEAAVKDLRIVRAESSVQLVPTEYFVRYIINSELDDGAKAKVEAYPKDGIVEFLLGAHGELESETKLIFTSKPEQEEAHDWFSDNWHNTFWQIQTRHLPIISIQDYSLWYNNQKLIGIKPEGLMVGKEMGMIEYLPTVGQPFSEFIFHTGLEAMTFTLFNQFGGRDRIPNAFKISYTHGLDFMNMTEIKQAEIRQAIVRRAMFKALPRIVPGILQNSESASVDGASYSKSNAGITWLNTERLAESTWIENIMREYNTTAEVVVT